MDLSLKNKILLTAIEKGYYISKEGIVFNKDGKEVKPQIFNGYKRFSVRSSYLNHPMPIQFHRLQAYKKFGNKIFDPTLEVRHIDGNSLNNSLDNIELGTASENTFDKSKETRNRVALNAIRTKQNLTRTEKERFEIYKSIIDGLSYKEIMIKHGISSKGTISYMKFKSKEFKKFKEFWCNG